MKPFVMFGTHPLLDLVKGRHGVSFPPLVHRFAMVSPMPELHEGVFVGAGSYVAAGAVVLKPVEPGHLVAGASPC